MPSIWYLINKCKRLIKISFIIRCVWLRLAASHSFAFYQRLPRKRKGRFVCRLNLSFLVISKIMFAACLAIYAKIVSGTYAFRLSVSFLSPCSTCPSFYVYEDTYIADRRRKGTKFSRAVAF